MLPSFVEQKCFYSKMLPSFVEQQCFHNHDFYIFFLRISLLCSDFNFFMHFFAVFIGGIFYV